MKQSEKLDLILNELFKYKNDGNYHSIGAICETLKIPINSNIELINLAHRLKNDGYINTLFQSGDCYATLTTYGIEYCEEDSYSYKGSAIITNIYSISVVNSPNSNIVNQSNNTTITQNISEINDVVEKIKEIVSTDSTINKELAENILECLKEIQDGLQNNRKPKFAIQSLINIAGNIASIGSYLTNLAQLI